MADDSIFGEVVILRRRAATAECQGVCAYRGSLWQGLAHGGLAMSASCLRLRRPSAGQLRGRLAVVRSISITRRTHQCPRLGPR